MIHVSTAYSNADKMTIQESVYKPPADPGFVINCCQKMSEDDLREMGRRMQGNHPNTYTMTKAMAEWVVAEQADDIPAAIVRPSIGMNYRSCVMLDIMCYVLLYRYLVVSGASFYFMEGANFQPLKIVNTIEYYIQR